MQALHAATAGCWWPCEGQSYTAEDAVFDDLNPSVVEHGISFNGVSVARLTQGPASM